MKKDKERKGKEKGHKKSSAKDGLQKREYEAAGHGRRFANWRAGSTSSNIENKRGYVKLRDRSRDLVRNNPFARRAVKLIANNTVGTGIIPTFISERKMTVKKLSKLWKAWAETTACDFEGRTTFYGLQWLAMKAVAESGEVLIRRRWVKTAAGKINIKLQILECDLINSARDLGIYPQGETYDLQGISYNADGTRNGYWMWNHHPSETFALRDELIPADEILHIYIVDRPGQQRGVPMGTAAMLRLRDWDEMEDAELVKQKIAACFSAFVSDSGNTDLGTPDENGQIIDKMEPGMIIPLNSGQTVTFGTPPSTTGYAEYSRKILQGVATGYGVTYEAMTGDLSGVNFSGGRMGKMDFKGDITVYQQHTLIPQMLSPVANWFLLAAFISAGITSDDISINWTAPAWEMIDPVKEAKGLIELVRGGVLPWQEAVRRYGMNPAEVLEMLSEDSKSFDDIGLMLTTDARYDATRTQDPGAEDANPTTAKPAKVASKPAKAKAKVKPEAKPAAKKTSKKAAKK
jgi:lambda family phage portal protein